MSYYSNSNMEQADVVGDIKENKGKGMIIHLTLTMSGGEITQILVN